jgi:hypothetical protein
MNHRYLVISLSALIGEICSTYYIRAAAQGDTNMMMFFAFIGPFLGLPFISFMIDAKTWAQRVYNALALSCGYVGGSLIVAYLINQ